jgi:hypothetical protein
VGGDSNRPEVRWKVDISDDFAKLHIRHALKQPPLQLARVQDYLGPKPYVAAVQQLRDVDPAAINLPADGRINYVDGDVADRIRIFSSPFSSAAEKAAGRDCR